MPKLKKAPALSLIEILVAISISGIITGIVASILVDSWNAQISQEAYSEIQIETRSVVNEISSAIQSASGVVTSITSGSNTYTTSSSVLVLKTPALDISGNILAGTDYLIFRRNPSKLSNIERVVIADAASTRASLTSPLVLANETSLLEMHYYNISGSEVIPGSGDVTTTDSVSVKARSERVVRNRTISREIDNKVHLRNN